MHLPLEASHKHRGPVFELRPPLEITEPRQIKVVFTQIQYSQMVVLAFNNIQWPHVSVATLVPADPIHVIPQGGW